MSGAAADRRTARVRIEGRVQGVGFRHWTDHVAGSLGLDGWVRNCRDGSVEAVFSGAPEHVAEMIERCREGPSSARVTSVEVLEVSEPPPAGFHVRPTA